MSAASGVLEADETRADALGGRRLGKVGDDLVALARLQEIGGDPYGFDVAALRGDGGAELDDVAVGAAAVDQVGGDEAGERRKSFDERGGAMAERQSEGLLGADLGQRGVGFGA